MKFRELDVVTAALCLIHFFVCCSYNIHCHSPRLLSALANVVLLSRSSSTDYSPVSDVHLYLLLAAKPSVWNKRWSHIHISKLRAATK